MHCCEAWEPVGKCFDQCSFECIDFHGLSQIIASLTRERIAEREAEYVTSLGHRRKKTMPWRSADLVFAPGAPRSQCSACTLPVKTATLWKMKTNRAGDYVNIGVRYLRRVLKPSGTVALETILRYVQQAPDDLRWVIDKNEVDELMVTKKESAPGPDGIPYSFKRCAGGLGSQVLFNAYKHALAGVPIPAQFAPSRTVFVPKSSDVGNISLIVRSPDAPRPLTQKYL